MELITLTKYPFLKEAETYLRENGPSLDELLTSKHKHARMRGLRRVLNSFDRKKLSINLATKESCLRDILAYISARIIVSSINDKGLIKYCIRKYALAESELCYNHLRYEDLGFILHAGKQFDIKAEESNGGAKMHFITYLKSTSKAFKYHIEWKLVNRPLENGYIIVDKKDFSKIVAGAFRRSIEQELPLQVNEKIQKKFNHELFRVKKKIKEWEKSCGHSGY